MHDGFVSGPVKAQAETEIAASEREVWAVLADIDGWPTWNPAVREATLDDDLEVGRRFRYATTVGAFRCRLREVDAPRRLAWSGRMLTMTSRQRWSIERAPQGCRVRTEASLSGIGARLFKARNAERLRAELSAVVALLKLEAETRIAESSDEAAEKAAEGDRDDE